MGSKRRHSSKAQSKPRKVTPPVSPKSFYRQPTFLWSAACAVIVAVAYALWTQVPNKPRVPSAQPPPSLRAAAPVLPSSVPAQLPERTFSRFEDFSGSEACAECHREQYDLWITSTHGQAGGKPGQVKVIAKFDGQPLYFKDAVVTPSVDASGQYRFTVEREGEPKMEIGADATIGGGHMFGGGTQTFFKQWPDGTVRFLPFDFIRRENLWFVQLRRDKTWAPISRDISLETDLANWPPHRVLGTLTEFSNCQNCHGSQIEVRYDPAQHRYDTHYQSLRVNCESCHGPARRHMELMRQPGHESRPDIGLESLATLSKDQSLLVCFQCHATKDAIREDPYLPGDRLEDYFSLKFPVFGDNPFLVDGRIRDFGYQSNHLYSDCYRDGSMTCVDCHDPHSQNYRDIFGNPLTGKFDNGQCTDCHASKARAPERHSHHKAGSPGNLCTSCHMPFLQHPGVGTRLVFARSDHTIPIPRPEFDASLGIENACQKCHLDKNLAWQEAQVRSWYGEIKPHPAMIASLLEANRVTDAKTAADLWLDASARHPMAQTAGLSTFIKRFLQPDMSAPAPEVVAKLKTLASGEDLDLKALALMALQVSCDQDPAVAAFLDRQRRGLGTKTEALLHRWSVAADYWGGFQAAQGKTRNALICFQKSLEILPDNIVTLSHLALAYLNLGEIPKAIESLKRAIQIKPYQAALHFQLAQIYARLEQVPQAIQALEDGLKYAPEDAKARGMLEYLRGR
jgi:tetratricopeptide (TPR) repeat protein